MILDDWLREFSSLVTKRHVVNAAVALFVLVLGAYIARRASDTLVRLPLNAQQRLLLGKVSYWGLLFAAIAISLGQLGFDIRVLLGAAGILTVAIGFAAQTSASNLISGIFLIGEKAFTVGDVIKVGEFMGEIVSIDLLSSKIRTFNNLMVRIPNETMMKANIINYSAFPIRRIDLNFSVAPESDLSVIESTVQIIAAAHPLCLDEPSPLFMVNGFTDTGLNIQLQAWTLTANQQALQNQLYRDIKLAFDQKKIRLAAPARSFSPQA